MRRLVILGTALAGIVGAAGACSSGDDDDDDDSGSGAAMAGPGVVTYTGGALGFGASTGQAATQGSGLTGAGATGTGVGAATGVGATTGGGTPQPVDPGHVLHPWSDSTFDACQAEAQIPEPYNVVLMFVVDVSGSMTQPAPGTNMTKWDATLQALSQVVQDLPPSVAMGIVYYPNMEPLPHTEPTDDPSECVNTGALVDPQLMTDDHRAMLNSSLQNVLVKGGTPTHTAYTVGVQALEAAGQRLPGNKYMLLITDGEPTYGVGCLGNGTTLAANMDPAYISDTLAAVEAASAIRPAQIGTFVIGSPGSELNYSGNDARPWLSSAATLGGTAPFGCSESGSPYYCHFDLTDPQTNFASGLTNALAQILGQVVACDYSRPAAPEGQELDPLLVDIKFVDGAGREFRVPLVNEADCGTNNHGWFWRPDGTLSLCLATCGIVREDALSGVEVQYGCEVPVI